jgi:F1F0 ATPase subunit 2
MILMADLAVLVLAMSLGIGLGLFYFGGLWLTLKHLPARGQPAILALGSFFVRSAICILGFYLISGSGLGALICGLAGFMISKVALIGHLGLGGVRNRWWS